MNIINKLFFSLNVIKVNIEWRVRLAGNVVCMGKMTNAHKRLDGKPEGNRPFGRHRPTHIWEDDIKTDIK
jgi:hypothetical protein